MGKESRHQTACRRPPAAPRAPVRLAALVMALAACPLAALAQGTAPAAPASAAPDGAPSEAARRQALGPYRMILQNANGPARTRTPAADARRAATNPGTPAAGSAPQAAELPVVRPAPPGTDGSAPASAGPVSSPAPTPAPAPALPDPVASRAGTPPGSASDATGGSPQSASAASLLPTPPSSPAPLAGAAPDNAARPPVAGGPAKPLIPIRQDPPELSGALARDRPEGTVRVGFEVLPDGSTAEVKVLSSSNRRLNSVALAAVSGWRFRPIDDRRAVQIDLVFAPDQ